MSAKKAGLVLAMLFIAVAILSACQTAPRLRLPTHNLLGYAHRKRGGVKG